MLYMKVATQTTQVRGRKCLGATPHPKIDNYPDGRRGQAPGRKRVIFGGRLGEYKYYDMDKVIASALEMCRREL